MEHFMIRFLISNLIIAGITGILLTAKHLLKDILSSRMQYRLWFVYSILLYVPFLPVEPLSCLLFSFLPENSRILSAAKSFTGSNTMNGLENTASWMNDFTLSVSRNVSTALYILIYSIWLTGICFMLLFMIRSAVRLRKLRCSADPVEKPDIKRMHAHCLKEMNIQTDIPIYSSRYIKSPVIAGVCKPAIYLPEHLVCHYKLRDIRYMLLHELQHYRHKDNLINYIMNLNQVIYWFNPFVWYALNKMKNEREIACDTSVLEMIAENEYTSYGMTLIDFSEKLSHTFFPFTAGIGSNMFQMKQRISNIAAYKPPSSGKRWKSRIAFILTAAVILGLAPTLSTRAVDHNRYSWNTSSKIISYEDFSSYFGKYEGSFVLYDTGANTWTIYNPEQAATRVSPDSTYKIYDALFSLESGIITSDNSYIAWDRMPYPFETWNTDQDLNSAMRHSVTWYFQQLDQQLGLKRIRQYITDIGYGNQNVNEDPKTYWLESSLKISPIEQVELLIRFYNNDLGFKSENIDAVKSTLRLPSALNGTLYGKTGTGAINGENVNGWFIGYVVGSGNTCFFAANIRGDSDTGGSHAAEIALSILSDLNI